MDTHIDDELERAFALELGPAPPPPRHRPRHRLRHRPWPLRRLPNRHARIAAIGAIAAMTATSAILLSGARFTRQDAAHVGVVRNGGPLDGRNIRQILMPGQKITWTGMYSQKPREYPASKVVLTYLVTADPRRGERGQVDVITVPTRDGVLVGLQGAIFYRFVGERDLGLLRRFDQTLGMRTYPKIGGGGQIYPWESDEGFAAMLDRTFRPVLDDDLRREVGEFRCEELVASCALLTQHRRPADTRTLKERQVSANRNIASIEARIERSLADDLAQTLGGAYFRDIRVRLAYVALPGAVQHAVDRVHVEEVAVSGARAQLRASRYEAQRSERLAKVYNESPALARIAAVKAAPKGSTIVINSGDDAKSPGINVGG
jgi:hypothetical protein